MIYGNINNIKKYDFLPGGIRECFRYIGTHFMQGYETGSHKIDEDRLFVNIAEYVTDTEENRIWEAHIKYIDVHYMIEGTEKIYVNFMKNMKAGEYRESEDFIPADGEKTAEIIMSPGDFLICYPDDVHKTGVAVNSQTDVKKAVFKVKTV